MSSAAVCMTLEIDPEMRERLERLAARRRRSQHWLMRDAIRECVEREEARSAFLQQAREAWQEYQETGLHASAEDVLAWLDLWGGESKTAALVCHE